MIEKDITKAILKEYLVPLVENDIDTLILGCTHYPLLKEQIHAIIGEISLVDSSKEIALLVLNTLKIQSILSDRQETGTINVFLSDVHRNFQNGQKHFLEKKLLQI